MAEWTDEEREQLARMYRDLRWFATDHMSEALAAVVKPFGDLAFDVAGTPASGAAGDQVVVAVQRLIEAKDAAVRVRVAADQIIEKNRVWREEGKV